MKKFSLLFLLFIILLVFSQFNCNSPTAPSSGLSLTLSDVSCTEAWLNLSAGSLPLPASIVVNKNGNNFLSFTLTSRDTTIYDSTLSPNQTYTYQAIYGNNKSETVTAKTLDTTSSNFTWQTFTFGGKAGSSAFYDCAIVNDTLAYAVGQVYLNDSTGQPDPQPYNFATWNGNNWKLQKIYFSYKILYPGSIGDTIGITSAKSIFAFSGNDVWLAAGTVQHWDGKQWKQFQGDYAGFSNKIWGTTTPSMYFVGNNGTIIHYSNDTWQKLESGTTLNINDIYGAYDEEKKKYEIFATASNILESLNRDFLEINGNTINNLSTNPIEGTLSSLWFIPGRTYYVCGGGIYQKESINDGLWKNGPFAFTNYYIYRIRGIGINDISATGGVGELLHFNGLSWKSYISQTRLPAGNYYGLDFKDNTIIAVGENNPQAVITVGKRVN